MTRTSLVKNGSQFLYQESKKKCVNCLGMDHPRCHKQDKCFKQT
jgi:hypothetical protein